MNLQGMTGKNADLALIRLGRLGFAPERRLDASYQHPGTKGLGDVIIRAAVKPGDNVVFLALGGEHDNGQRPGCFFAAHRAADFVAILAGQHQIQHHGVHPLMGQHAERFLATVGTGYVKASLDQVVTDQLLDIGIVFHHKDTIFFHTFPPHS